MPASDVRGIGATSGDDGTAPADTASVVGFAATSDAFGGSSSRLIVLFLNSSSPCTFLKQIEQYELKSGDPKNPQPPAHEGGPSLVDAVLSISMAVSEALLCSGVVSCKQFQP